jgi:hypothetical protein
MNIFCMLFLVWFTENVYDKHVIDVLNNNMCRREVHKAVRHTQARGPEQGFGPAEKPR